MTNSVIQWNCRGLRPNFYELNLLVVNHNPLAVCLQETFLKDTDNIIVRGFNLYHKFHETENSASGGVSILVNENVPQSIVTLNTTLQAVAVNVTAHKTITICSVYLPPRNHFNFNPKDLQNAISFYFVGDFNGHHTLWGCEDVNNRGQQLEDLILKNDLILFNDKSQTYFHSASDTFTSIDLTFCSPSLFFDFSWKGGPDICGSDHFAGERWTSFSWKGSNMEAVKGKLGSIPASMQHSSAPIGHCRCWWSHVFVHFHIEGHCRRNYS